MAIQSIRLAQDPRDPNKRWLEFTQVYGTSPTAQGYPEQYLLTPEQFAQFQNAGLQAEPEWNNPLYYNKGQFDPQKFSQLANLPGNQNGQGSDIARKLAATVSQMATTGGTDLANDTTRIQSLLDTAMGGKNNPLTNYGSLESAGQAALGSQANQAFANQPDDTAKVAMASLNQPTKQTQGKQFYRVGKDIFEAGTNRHIGPHEWNRDWAGKSTEVQQNGAVTSPSAPPQTSAGAAPTPTNQLPFGLNQNDLQSPAVQVSLKQQGYTINQDGTVTPPSGGQGGQDTGGQDTQNPQGGNDVNNTLISFGLTQDEINSMPDSWRTSIAALWSKASSKYNKGQTDFNIQQAFQEAMNDRDIQAQYGDALKTAANDFQFNLSQLMGGTADWAAQQATQFYDARRALDESIANQGLASSGLRKVAEDRLKQQQQGIVSSQRRQIAQNLYDLGKGMESQFGSSNAPTASLTYNDPLTGKPYTQTYQPMGGIFGSQILGQQQAEANQFAANIQQQKLAQQSLTGK